MQTTTNSASAKTSQTSVKDAFSVLTTDHRAVEKMYKQYEKLAKARAAVSERQTLAQQICAELSAHLQAEEEIFYPALRSELKDQGMLDEADVEHESVESLISQIMAMGADEEKYDAKVSVLCEYVAHHVKEEEEEMFPQARRLKSIDWIAMGEKIVSRKEKLLARKVNLAGKEKAAKKTSSK
jgi:hemerythrin superfamily protein